MPPASKLPLHDDEARLKKIWKAAFAYAVRWHRHEDAEDFAQWYVQRQFEGKTKQPLQHAFIDYCRKQGWGKKGHHGNQMGYTEWLSALERRAGSDQTVLDTLASGDDKKLEYQIEIELRIKRLPPILRAVFLLYYDHGYSELEIAKLFDLSDSRIHHLLTRCHHILSEVRPTAFKTSIDLRRKK